MIPGFVLAGGRSLRMGQDKALVQLDGIALASRMAHTMSQAGCTQVTLVGRQTYLADLGWPALSETEAGHHPLGA